MKHIIIFLLGFVSISAFSQKVGVNTINPAQLYHIDSKKNNTTATPTAAEAADDIVVTTAGNMGIGTINPSNKLEINSGTTDITGLKFSQLNNNSPVNTTAGYIGVDATGNVVRLPSPKAGVFTQNAGQSTAATAFTAKGGQLFSATGTMDTSNYTVVPNSTYTVTNQNVLNIYYVNYTFSVDVVSINTPTAGSNSGGSSYYECRLFIDGMPTTAAQSLREFEVNGSLQFSLNYVRQLSTAGNHTFDLRIMRVQNSGVETNTTLTNLTNFSLTYGISVLSFN